MEAGKRKRVKHGRKKEKQGHENPVWTKFNPYLANVPVLNLTVSTDWVRPMSWKKMMEMPK
jgi:hypothetical protein